MNRPGRSTCSSLRRLGDADGHRFGCGRLGGRIGRQCFHTALPLPVQRALLVDAAGLSAHEAHDSAALLAWLVRAACLHGYLRFVPRRIACVGWGWSSSFNSSWSISLTVSRMA